MKKVLEALIVDDEATHRKMLRYRLEEHAPHIHVVGEATNGEDACRAIQRLQPDLVFLDVHMPKMSGLEVLDCMPTKRFLTVLHSADALQVTEAYDRNVVYFLPKPLRTEHLQRCVKRIEGVHGKRSRLLIPEERKKVALYVCGQMHYVPYRDIVYVEAAGSYSIVHRENGKRMVVSRNLKRMAEELGDILFYRVHNSYLINLSKVESCSFQKNLCMMRSGAQVRMAIRRTEELRGRLESLWSMHFASYPTRGAISEYLHEDLPDDI